jgi:hypothetical protein
MIGYIRHEKVYVNLGIFDLSPGVRSTLSYKES